MSRVFLAYRFTGEDKKTLHDILGQVRSSLEAAGHEVFCTFWLEEFFRNEGYTKDQIYDYALQKMAGCDMFFSFVRTEDRSHGMELESKRAQDLGIRYVLAIREDLDFDHFRTAAHEIIEYNDLGRLCQSLQGLR